MTNYFSKDELTKIKMLNKALGVNHRTEPYDIKNTDDLKELLKMVTCAYLDYYQYCSILCDVDENFDESIECYDPATWMNLTIDASLCNPKIIKAVTALHKADKAFEELKDDAEKECRRVLELILSLDAATKKEIFGEDLKLNKEQIDSIFENIMELEYHYAMDESFEAFLLYVKSYVKK